MYSMGGAGGNVHVVLRRNVVRAHNGTDVIEIILRGVVQLELCPRLQRSARANNEKIVHGDRDAP